MPVTAIYASRVLTPQDELKDAVILVEDGCVAALGHRDEVTVPQGAVDYVANGMTVVPGFIDIHIHGAGGHDVMEGNARALDKITSTVARYGTTSIVATTVTAPADATCKSVEGIARYIRKREQERAAQTSAEILGIHFEGPFISKAQRGVHPPESLAKPSTKLLDQFLQAADGLARIVTLAPELPGGLELVAHAKAAGLVVSMGHTDADYGQAREAIRAGARHATHMYNAMRPFTHRDPGVIAAVMTEPDVTAEIISDLVHVAAPAIQILLGVKGFDTVIAITDGIAASGMPDGTYRLGTFEVTVKDGVCRNSEGKLAGSTLTLDRALRNLVSLGVPFADAIRMMTILPARRLGLAGKKGILAVGSDADLVVLTPELRVAGVMARGVGLV
ncbi:MAG TPA: N-acetylglucosamine-6-phosphate deacetylase [Candidatus Acidoferrum sp.]|nr:N-acetylglucosamine-6-phosphate deacetylase [Candidatus Acidoferrum sp.]